MTRVSAVPSLDAPSSSGPQSEVRRKPPRDAQGAPGRWLLVDALRACASLLIVWHHLAFYGPVADIAWPLAPRLFGWLDEDGRCAVAIFFVLSGWAAGRSTARLATGSWGQALRLLASRLLRLGLPYLAAITLALIANEVARAILPHPAISAPPQAVQLVAHAFFLQDVLGYEALTAGIWFVAIDVQLFLILSLLALGLRAAPTLTRWLTGLGQPPLGWVLLPIALASLLVLGRDPAWDVWALYFLGLYYAGLLLAWSEQGLVRARWVWAWSILLAAVGVADGRPRLLWAAATCALLLVARRSWGARVAAGLSAPLRLGLAAVFGLLGRLSYALFLVHFPVSLVLGLFWVRFVDATHPLVALLGLALSYGLSLGTAALFHRYVERPTLRLVEHVRSLRVTLPAPRTERLSSHPRVPSESGA